MLVSSAGELHGLVKSVDHSEQATLDLMRGLSEFRIIDPLHGGDWVDRSNLRFSMALRLHNDIARQHRSNFVFDLQRLVGE